MNIFKRILAVIITLVVLLAAFAVFALKSGFFTVDARDYVISLIQKNTGKDVRIGKIEIGLVNNIVVHDVSLPVARTFSEAGEFATIKAIIIRFNLIDLILRRKQIDKTMSHIIIESPFVYLKKEDGKFNLENFVSSFTMPEAGPGQSANVALPINRIFIQNGKVLYEDRDRKFSSYADSFSGTLLLKTDPLLLRINLNGKTKNSDRKNFMVDVDYYIKPGRFRGNLNASDVALNDWGSYLLQPQDYSINSGNFSVNAGVSGTEFSPDKMKIYGSLDVSNGDITVKGSVPVRAINAGVEINNDRVKIRSGAFNLYGGLGVIKGGISRLFTGTDFNFKLTIDRANLAEAAPGQLSGTANILAIARGNRDKQQAEAVLLVPEGSLRKMDIKGFETRAVLKDNAVKLVVFRGSFGGGALSGSGGIGLKTKKIDISISDTGMNATKLFGALEVTGAVDMGLKVSGDTAEPKIIAVFKSPNIKYSGNDVEALDAKFYADSKKITGGATLAYKKYRNLNLAVKIDLSGEKISINEFRLRNGQEMLVDTKGSYGKKDRALDIAVNTSNILLSDLAISWLGGKDVDGGVRGSLFVRGTSGDPLVDLYLNMDALKIKGARYKLLADVHYGQNVIKIKEINFNDNLKGAGEFSLKKRIFGMNFDVKSLNGDVLKEVMGFNMMENGVINGRMVVKKENGGYGGNIDMGVTYAKGIYKSAKVEISGANNNFVINKIEVKQKKGNVNLGGSFTNKNDEQLDLSLNGFAENFRVNDKLALSGTVNHSSSVKLGTDMVSSDNSARFTKLVFNSIPQDPLDIDIKTEGRSVPLLRVKWGPSYLVDAKLDAEGEDTPQINALVQLRDADLYPLYTLLNNRDRPLPAGSIIKGEFTIKGPVDGAAFAGNLSQLQGITSVQGYIGLEKKKGIYKLSNFNLKYNAVNVDLLGFVNIFDEKYRDTGRLNGKGELSGRPEKLESSGSVIISQGKMAGLPYDSIAADYTYKNTTLTVEKAALNYKESFIKLDGSKFQIKAADEFDASINASMKDFVWRGNRFNGEINFFGRINTEKNLTVKGSVSSENFMFKKHAFQPFLINLGYNNDLITLKTSDTVKKGKGKLNAEILNAKDTVDFKLLTFDQDDGNRLLSMNGFIDKRKDHESALLIDVKNADPQMANDLLDWDHKWTGTGNGNIKISGNPDKGLALTIYVTLANGTVDNVEFDIFTGLVSVKGDWVDLSPVDMMLLSKTDKYDVRLGGKIPVALTEAAVERIKGVEMDLKAKVKNGDLSLIKFLKFIDDASGPIDADITIRGTREYPSISGKINVADADVKLKYLFRELKSVYANVLIKDNVLDIYTAKADTERGTIKVENLDEKKGGTLKFMRPYELNWRITNVGDKVRLTDTPYLEFVSGDADMDLEMTGLMEAPTVKGVLKFDNARIVYPVNAMTKTGEKTTLKDNYAMKITWDLLVYGGENVRYFKNFNNNFADIFLKFGDQPVKFLGKGLDMKIFGKLGVTRGTYKYLNTEFDSDSTKPSSIIFDGDRRPILDMYASTLLRKFELYNHLSNQRLLPSGVGVPDTANMNTMNQETTDTDLNIFIRFFGRVGDVKLDINSSPSLNRDRLIYIVTTGMDAATEITTENALKFIDVFVNSWLKGGTEALQGMIPVKLGVKINNLAGLAGGGAQPTPGAGAPESTTRTTDIEFNVGLPVGKSGYLSYTPKLFDVTNQFNQFNIQHTLGFDWATDNTSKLSLTAIFNEKNAVDPVGTPIAMDLRATYGWNWNFGSWGEKPTPTPVPTPKGR